MLLVSAPNLQIPQYRLLQLSRVILTLNLTDDYQVCQNEKVIKYSRQRCGSYGNSRLTGQGLLYDFGVGIFGWKLKNDNQIENLAWS